MRFKAVRTPWAQNGQYLYGWVRVVINGIKVDPQPRCGVCLAPQSRGIQRGHCVYMMGGGLFVTSHIR